MKFGKLYSDATKLTEEQSSEQPEQSVAKSNEDAARAQMMFNWLQSTPTQEMVKSITEELSNLLSESVNLAKTYPTHQNHHKIIQNLIRVDTLNNLIESYVRRTK